MSSTECLKVEGVTVGEIKNRCKELLELGLTPEEAEEFAGAMAFVVSVAPNRVRNIIRSIGLST